nr:hypothetical protein [Haloferax sp. KTX1]
MKYGGAVIGGGLFAGCSQRDSAATQTDAAPATETATPTATETATPEDTSYTVTMAPAGDVEFDAVPETWMAYYSNYGDMGIALGKLDSLQALVYRENKATASGLDPEAVHPQGTRWQGPLMNLFQTEMTAKQLYPDQFGAWPTDEDGDDYPEFGDDEQLFDHGRVEEIVTDGEPVTACRRSLPHQ